MPICLGRRRFEGWAGWALSEYLGHPDAGRTLRTYTHLMPDGAERTRRAIDGPLVRPAPRQQRRGSGARLSSRRNSSAPDAR